MKVFKKGKNTIIDEIKDFDLTQTLECGQCFNFHKLDDDEYLVVAFGNAIKIKQEKHRLIFFNTKISDVRNIWIHYFDLDRDYAKIKNYLRRKDPLLRDAVKEFSGVRLMNQEFHSALISFIISQNKQIPHIKKICRDICEHYGKYIGEIEGIKCYSFPTIDELSRITEKQFRDLKTGFRAPYLVDACHKLKSGEISEEKLISQDCDDCRCSLTSIKGVGDKVANCAMLFSLGKREAFPIDVWIYRIMVDKYFDGKQVSKDEIAEFAKKKYGKYGGYAQQYMFAARNNIKEAK